jgi:hypothetical protein
VMLTCTARCCCCWCCCHSELAAAVHPYVTTVVMRYDLVPRFSAGQVRSTTALVFKGMARVNNSALCSKRRL